MVGPWSYVQDPADSSRIVVVAPQVGHTMAVFTGEDPYNHSHPQMQGTHRLEFSTTECNSPSSSDHLLYPMDNVTQQTISDALTSNSTYSLSLPKPCSYEAKDKSRLRLNPTQPVSSADQEQSLTTWMILRYNVTDSSIPTDFDKGTANARPIPFGSNAGSNKKAISVILYVHPSVGGDRQCDKHSAAIFDSTLAMWKSPHVYHVFPGVIPSTTANANQQLNLYDYTCDQGPIDPDGIFVPATEQSPSSKSKVSAKAKRRELAPGRADCHAPQVNINGLVK
jgi:hypothetical protein